MYYIDAVNPASDDDDLVWSVIKLQHVANALKTRLAKLFYSVINGQLALIRAVWRGIMKCWWDRDPLQNNPTFLGQLEEFSMEYTFGNNSLFTRVPIQLEFRHHHNSSGCLVQGKEVGSGYECRLEFYDINLVKYWFTNSKNLDKMGSPKQKGVKYIHRILSLIPGNGTHCLMSTHNNLRFLFSF